MVVPRADHRRGRRGEPRLVNHVRTCKLANASLDGTT
jgi:hypothetical protein